MTSGWAFSTSSRRTTLYGRWRTGSVRTPPSPYPTYPGGDPLSNETVCFSWYSDMLTEVRKRSPPNSRSAIPRAVSVLPTPLGPTNMKTPIGADGLAMPALEARRARPTAASAWSWPLIRDRRRVSNSRIVFAWSRTMFPSGMPVQSETVFATVSGSTSSGT